ncbi:1,4-dihydroxy-2-naphthoate polyprenyltransferase [Melioribacteraceae bacterium 4301-Me]|uniref:1,4-dihydroxy-2-naphthoate polyprenyltransferase n=1 Tax=Pyranulibacter aquaticus TaxID=3163344 RepID=UPI0035985279
MLRSTAKSLSKLDSWVLASRPKTLPAAVVPVVVGSALAIHDGKFNALASLIALTCSLLIQIGTNFANDLYDFLAGTDKKDRVGPTRVLASGLIKTAEMKIAIALVFGATFLLGLYLVYLGGWPILIIGILSILAGLAYTAGPFPLAYNGLGDIFVFLFFGFVGTVGTYYVQTLTVTTLSILSSIPVGALITNILVVNNYRDIEEDFNNGKFTLAVKFGERFSRVQYVIFMILSYAVLFFVYFFHKQSLIVFLPVLTLPMSLKLVRMIYTHKGKELNKTLELTARLSAIYGFLFAIGILI